MGFPDFPRCQCHVESVYCDPSNSKPDLDHLHRDHLDAKFDSKNASKPVWWVLSSRKRLVGGTLKNVPVLEQQNGILFLDFGFSGSKMVPWITNRKGTPLRKSAKIVDFGGKFRFYVDFALVDGFNRNQCPNEALGLNFRNQFEIHFHHFLYQKLHFKVLYIHMELIFFIFPCNWIFMKKSKISLENLNFP